MKRIILVVIATFSFSTALLAQFDVSPDSRSVSAEAGTTSFSVSAPVDYKWAVEDNASWLTATLTSTTVISVSYEANPSTSSRTAYIKVSGPGVEEIVTVIQAGATAYLDVSPNNRDVSSESGSTTFVVSANVDWSVTESASWLNATKIDRSLIGVTYDANTSVVGRTAYVTVQGAGGVQEVVTVCQSGVAAYFDVSPDSRSVSSTAGSTTFSLSTNITNPFWIVEDNATWLTATKTNENTIGVTYNANTSTSPRTASINVFMPDGPEGEILYSETVTVTQAGAAAYLDVTPDSRSVGAASGSTTFSVSTNVTWSVADDATWLTATKTDGSTIGVSYNANTSTG
ncbi:MAG TPA: hypothetical protein ENO20_11175, partial [Bacteroides sp.]|nr:hypothetical protein [Bacteroides sp.]